MQLQSFFEQFLKGSSIFINKKLLQPNYLPDQVIERDEFMHEIAKILAPALKNEKPSNLFIYGKTGTGKTLSVKHVLQSMEAIALKKELPLKYIYINCKLKKVADTEYRLIAQLIKEFGQEIPATGLPTDEVYTIFYSLLDKEKKIVMLVLDEIDQLTRKIGDEILIGKWKNKRITIEDISIDSFGNPVVNNGKIQILKIRIPKLYENKIKLKNLMQSQMIFVFIILVKNLIL